MKPIILDLDNSEKEFLYIQLYDAIKSDILRIFISYFFYRPVASAGTVDFFCFHVRFTCFHKAFDGFAFHVYVVFPKK